MTNEDLQIDVLGSYNDSLEIRCIDAQGNEYTIQGEGNSHDDDNILLLKLRRVPKKKGKK